MWMSEKKKMKKIIKDGMLVKSRKRSNHYGIGVVVNSGFTPSITQVYWVKLGKTTWFCPGKLVLLKQVS